MATWLKEVPKLHQELWSVYQFQCHLQYWLKCQIGVLKCSMRLCTNQIAHNAFLRDGTPLLPSSILYTCMQLNRFLRRKWPMSINSKWLVKLRAQHDKHTGSVVYSCQKVRCTFFLNALVSYWYLLSASIQALELVLGRKKWDWNIPMKLSEEDYQFMCFVITVCVNVLYASAKDSSDRFGVCNAWIARDVIWCRLWFVLGCFNICVCECVCICQLDLFGEM